jgi:hypothetical protein
MANRFLNNITINDAYTFPDNDGSDGQAIVTDGAGNLTFGSVAAASAESTEAVHIPVKNTSGSQILKGTPVYVTGETGNSGKIEIAPADASSASTMPCLGLLESTLSNNSEGFCVQGGLLEGLSTATIDGTSANANDTVYVKSGGGLTLTKPTGTGLIQNVAKVARTHASQGSLVVSAILRTNDVPNLPSGKIWVGDGNTTTSTVIHLDETNNRLGINDTTPGVTLDISGTDAIKIPAGTEAERPTGVAGMLRYNSDDAQFEGYTTEWGAIAGSGGGGGGGTELSIERNVFTATANQTAFTISSAITASSNTQVYIDGVYQAKSNYTTSGAVITFSTGVPAGAEVEVVHFISVLSKVYTDTFTGDASTVNFTASKDVSDENVTQVYIDGVYQSKDNYTTSGTTITFSTAPPSGSAIEVVHFTAATYSTLNSNQFTGTGSQTDFTLTQVVDVDTSFVFIQGVYQEKDQYSISGTTLTFTTAPLSGYSIEVITVGAVANVTSSPVNSVNGLTGDVTVSGGTDWQSTIKTADFTAEAGKGYFVNTTSAAITVTLPAGVVGTEIVIQDYAGTFATNKVILNANGSEKIQGSTIGGQITTNNATAVLIYQDATKGWTSQDVTINLPPLNVDYLVVAGGGAASDYVSGGGGGGGLRTSYGSTSGGGATAESTLTLSSSTNYTVTVGEGGVGGTVRRAQSLNGGDSIFSTITSIGGGGSGIGGGDTGSVAVVGGSGGGGGSSSSGSAGAAGTANQGYAGGSTIGAATPSYPSAGGGGAGAVGQSITSGSSVGGNGGNGLEVNIIGGSGNYYAGGGGGTSMAGGGSGGTGGGGTGATVTSNGGTSLAGTSGVINTGGGAGGGSGVATGSPSGSIGVSGGSGVVILRYPSSYFIHKPGTLGLSTTTVGSDKVTTFTSGSGNITFEATEQPTIAVDYLVVAGGGSSGAAGGGGGGGGGLRTSYGSTTGGGGSAESTLNPLLATNYTVTVGAGGAGVSHANSGNDGSSSVFASITSTGGGGGGAYPPEGRSGGSGGGCGQSGQRSGTGTGAGGSASSPTQGYPGGSKPTTATVNYVSAGGGGAGAAGGNVPSDVTPGAGGIGLAVNILSSSNASTASVGEVSGGNVYYAGGGGGSNEQSSPGAAGGLGGGTQGATGCPGTAPSPGVANTGGGNGGAGGCGSAYSTGGGSGVVILRYPSSYTVTVGAGITQASGSPFTEGSNKVSVFTAGTGNIQFN